MTDTAENAPAPAQAGTPPSDHVPLRTWIAFIVMAFGMFMAILDIQIVASALTDIQAGISASADEIAWARSRSELRDASPADVLAAFERAMQNEMEAP